MYRSSYSRSMPVLVGALSGIEMAMWDVFGKVVGMPIWKLLGGSVRERIRVYTGIGGTTPDECAESAKKAVMSGFRAVKMGTAPQPVRFVDTSKTIDAMVARIAAVRTAVGDEVDIASHNIFSRSVGRVERFVFGGMSHEMYPQRGQRISSSTRFLTVPVLSGFRRV